MRWALPASALLHAAGLATLLLGGEPPAALPDTPLLEIELVQQAPSVQGSTPVDEADPKPAAPDQASAAEPGPDGASPPPAPPPAPGRPAAAAVNLGDAERDLDGLVVTGQNVVPPRPDALFRNQPPRYPADAARRGAHGTVGLVIQVGADGVPAGVAVAASSGTASLDRAARDAVLLWRFTPAQSGGRPVPFEYRLNVRFTAGEQ